ncbi:MAG: phytoene/squalene synthase family protein [Saprospiraceae bacterium]|nr:phytoene/squalene synthase family protein [Saprospiraceae bacterium]
MNYQTFERVTQECSRQVTTAYSTSFSIGISLLNKSVRNDIYAIYAYVRFADEIVDTFHDFDKAGLLNNFIVQTYDAISQGISLNPILHQFQKAVNAYQIDKKLLESFLNSMIMDLEKKDHTRESYEHYIVGSAEAVGLMCLQVFCKGDLALYNQLAPFASRLGAAFQKVNFLRDIRADTEGLGRYYFPHWQSKEDFSEEVKGKLLDEIRQDFKYAREGISRLPDCCKTGVYAAYVYYKALLIKIARTPSKKLACSRVRINNITKLALLFYAGIRVKLSGLR